MMVLNFASKNLFRECYATFICNHFFLLCGLMYSFPACLIPQLEKDGYSLDTQTKSLLGSAGVLAVPIMTPLTIPFIGKTGRKRTMQITLLLIVGLLVITMFSTSILVLCCSLSIANAIGNLFVPAAVAYITETCKKDRRGVFLASSFISFSSGSAIIFIFNSFAHWRVIAAFLILLGLSCLCQTFLLPESPYYQILVGKKAEAESSLLWYQTDLNPMDVQRKMEDVEKSLTGTNTNNSHFKKLWSYLQDKKVLKPLFIGILISFFRCGEGRVILSMYLYNILGEDLHVPFDLEKWTAIYGAVYLVYVVCIVAITRNLKRKPAVYLWCAIMSIFLIIAIIYKFLYNANVDVPGWIPIVAIYIYFLFSMSGLYPVTYTIAVEIQVAYCRPEMTTLLNGVINLFFGLYTYIFPYVEILVPIEYVFMYFLLNITVLPIVVGLLVPETSSLEHFDTMDTQKGEKIDEKS